NVIEGFRTAFTGVRAGDAKEFSVTYPAEIENKKLAGKRVDYSGEVTSVRVKQLPELDNDFASQIDEEVETLDELKANIRKDLEHRAEHRSDSEMREGLRKELLEKHKFEVPQRVVAKQAESRVKTFARRLAQQHFNPNSMKLDWEALYEAQKTLAEEDVRWAFILDRVAKAENIEVTDEEVDKEIEKLAESSGKSAAVLKANLTKEKALGSIKEQLENRKAIDLVIASANVTTEEVEGLGANQEADEATTDGEGRTDDGQTENDAEDLADDSEVVGE
ncbi:MAG TPA: trigger factor, partial [Blastocatellia bacterium]|nr:trigger factor [Blastocatellia bacterium]